MGKEITPGDRYRLFLPLEEPITNPDRYKTIVTGLIEEFQADKACKDTGRFYYCNLNQEVHFLEGDKYWDISQYKSEEKQRRKTKMNMINKETLITDEDGNTMRAKEWFPLLEKDSVMIHCPLSPESHKNNDANASCSMNRNGDYVNLNCFACGNKKSLHLGVRKRKSSSKSEFTYSVPDFDKESATTEVAKGMNTMTELVSELVRLLPVLEKKEKKDD